MTFTEIFIIFVLAFLTGIVYEQDKSGKLLDE